VLRFGRAFASVGWESWIHNDCPMKKISLPAPRKGIRLGQISLGGTKRVLSILVCLFVITRADASAQELQNWVQNSILIFTGKVVRLGSNVGGIKSSDNPITVEVERIEFGNEEALSKFGSLIGKQMTVVVNPSFKIGPKLKPGVSAVFFVNPLLYEKNIAVRAEAVADTQSIKDLAKLLPAAIEEFKKKPLNDALKLADKVVSGIVVEVRPLSGAKLAELQSLDNGRYFYSEHSPRWREAVIRVQSTLKGAATEKTIILIFPSTKDRMWAKAPKCRVGQTGTWLLHTGVQLKEGAKVLLTPDKIGGEAVTAYTSLRPQEFQPKDSTGKNEKLIREMLKKSSPP